MSNETKFTKGEWYAHPNGVGCSGIAIVNTPNGCVIPKHEDSANRDLIAAAPEMYKALQRTNEELAFIIDMYNKKVKDPANFIDAETCHENQLLLVKARGESK